MLSKTEMMDAMTEVQRVRLLKNISQGQYPDDVLKKVTNIDIDGSGNIYFTLEGELVLTVK